MPVDDNQIKGALVSLGFREPASTSDSTISLEDADFPWELPGEEDIMYPDYSVKTETYERNKRKVSLVRTRTETYKETLAFTKGGRQIALTHSPKYSRLRAIVKSNQPDLEARAQSQIDALPRETPIQQKITLVYQQLLTYADAQKGQ
jgi:hypothetical protein